MVKRIPVVVAMALAAVLAWQPAAAQTAKARATAKVDLEARFKEAQADPKLADDLYKVGRKVAAVCANCHGEGGNGGAARFRPRFRRARLQDAERQVQDHVAP